MSEQNNSKSGRTCSNGMSITYKDGNNPVKLIRNKKVYVAIGNINPNMIHQLTKHGFLVVLSNNSVDNKIENVIVEKTKEVGS